MTLILSRFEPVQLLSVFLVHLMLKNTLTVLEITENLYGILLHFQRPKQLRDEAESKLFPFGSIHTPQSDEFLRKLTGYLEETNLEIEVSMNQCYPDWKPSDRTAYYEKVLGLLLSFNHQDVTIDVNDYTEENTEQSAEILKTVDHSPLWSLRMKGKGLRTTSKKIVGWRTVTWNDADVQCVGAMDPDLGVTELCCWTAPSLSTHLLDWTTELMAKATRLRILNLDWKIPKETAMVLSRSESLRQLRCRMDGADLPDFLKANRHLAALRVWDEEYRFGHDTRRQIDLTASSHPHLCSMWVFVCRSSAHLTSLFRVSEISLHVYSWQLAGVLTCWMRANRGHAFQDSVTALLSMINDFHGLRFTGDDDTDQSFHDHWSKRIKDTKGPQVFDVSKFLNSLLLRNLLGLTQRKNKRERE